MARTIQQIETDIQNNVTIKLMEYVKDYFAQISNINTDKINELMAAIYSHINGLDVVVGHIGKPHTPSATPPQNPNDYDWYYDTSDNSFKMWHNGAWQVIAHLSSTIDAYTKAESNALFVSKTGPEVQKIDRTEVVARSAFNDISAVVTTTEDKIWYETDYLNAPVPTFDTNPFSFQVDPIVLTDSPQNQKALMRFQNADKSIDFILPINLVAGGQTTDHDILLTDGTRTTLTVTLGVFIIGQFTIRITSPKEVFADRGIRLIKIWEDASRPDLSGYVTYTVFDNQMALKANTLLNNVTDSDLRARLLQVGIDTTILKEFKGVLPTAPIGTHEDLDWYINDTDYKIYVWHNSQWNAITGPGGAMSKAEILNVLGITQASLNMIMNPTTLTIEFTDGSSKGFRVGE